MRSHRGDLRLSNPDWNEYELLGGIRWLRAMPGNSLDQEAAGRDRITITTANGDRSRITHTTWNGSSLGHAARELDASASPRGASVPARCW
jgi:hypothetical protein